MAVSDLYAVAQEYRNAIDKDDDSEDGEIEEDLEAVSRYLDRKLGTFFTKDASAVTRIFDGNGSRRLYFSDHAPVPGIASQTGLVVKVDLDSDYDVSDADETLTLDTDFWLGPWDADKGPEAAPWSWIEIHPDSSKIGAFPAQRRAVEVTAIWGWPEVPVAIKRATIQLTGILRLDTPRATRRVQEGVDAAIETSRDGQRIVHQLYEQYGTPGRQRLSVGAV